MEAIEMAAPAKRIEVVVEDRRELERIVRSRTAERRMVERARIVLAAAEGRSAARIASEVGCSEPTVKKWRRRFEADGLAGLRDAPRPGRPLVHGPETRARLIALACTRPGESENGLRRERWTHRELGEQVGMSESQAHAILRAAGASGILCIA
jgi:transposase